MTFGRPAAGAGLRPRAFLSTAFAVVLLLFLAACGGGGGGGTSPPPAISITAQPADVHVEEGADASFTVGTSGSAAYEWQRLADGAWSDIAGGTHATLALPAVHAADSGAQFHVIVTSTADLANRVTSSTVTLTVDPVAVAPSITTQPATASVTDGALASFSVTAAGTNLAYRWQRSTDGATWSDVGGATLSTYAFTVVSTDDGLRMRVIISNTLGTVTSAAAPLKVMPAPVLPTFTAAPSDTTVAAGSPVTFTAIAAGSPAPTLTWWTSTDAVTWVLHANATGGSFTLATTSLSDNGLRVKVVAANDAGTTEAYAVLSVVAPAAPVFTTQPVGATLASGRTLILTAQATAVPAAIYQWQVSTDVGATFTNVNGATSATYLVNVTLVDDRKQFRVVASNLTGSATSDAVSIHVLDVPVVTSRPFIANWHPGQRGAYFLVGASGQELHYQWQTTLDNVTFQDVPGATGPSLLLSPTASAIAAACVTVSNAVGSASACGYPNAVNWGFAAPLATGVGLRGLRWLDATTALAVGDTSTIVRSTDGGATWRVVLDGNYSDWPLQGLALSGQAGIAVGSAGNVKRSIDGGQHWSDVYQDDKVDFRAVTFTDPGRAVAVGRGGRIRVSDDRGATWHDASTDTGQFDDLDDVAFNHAGVGLTVGAGARVARSTDGGATWTSLRLPETSAELRSVAFASDNVAVTVSFNGDVYRTADAGANWTRIIVGGGSPSLLTGVHFAPDGLTGIAVGRTDRRILRTTDAGASWTTVDTLVWGQLASVRFDDASQVVAVGDEGLVLRSADSGLGWTQATRSRFASLRGVAFVSPTVGVAVGDGVLVRSVDAGKTWVARSVPAADSLQGVAFADASVGVAVGAANGVGSVLRTVDAGLTWTAIDPHLNFQMNAVAFASSAVGVAALEAGLARTTDAGLTWTTVPGTASSWFTAVAFGDARTGVAVTAGGDLWRTIDAGATWTRTGSVHSAFPELDGVAFASPTTVVAVGDIGQVMRSTDAGATWQAGDNEWDTYVLSAVAFSSATDGVAVSRDGGLVLRTQDGGLTWAEDDRTKVLSLRGVAAAGTQAMVAVGLDGMIFRTDQY